MAAVSCVFRPDDMVLRSSPRNRRAAIVFAVDVVVGCSAGDNRLNRHWRMSWNKSAGGIFEGVDCHPETDISRLKWSLAFSTEPLGGNCRSITEPRWIIEQDATRSTPMLSMLIFLSLPPSLPPSLSLSLSISISRPSLFHLTCFVYFSFKLPVDSFMKPSRWLSDSDSYYLIGLFRPDFWAASLISGTDSRANIRAIPAPWRSSLNSFTQIFRVMINRWLTDDRYSHYRLLLPQIRRWLPVGIESLKQGKKNCIVSMRDLQPFSSLPPLSSASILFILSIYIDGDGFPVIYSQYWLNLHQLEWPRPANKMTPGEMVRTDGRTGGRADGRIRTATCSIIKWRDAECLAQETWNKEDK